MKALIVLGLLFVGAGCLFTLGAVFGWTIAGHSPVSFLEADEPVYVSFENSQIELKPNMVVVSIDNIKYIFVDKDTEKIADRLIGAQMFGQTARLEFASISFGRGLFRETIRLPRRVTIDDRIVYQR